MEFSERYEQYMYSYPHKTAYRSLHGINFIDYFPKREEEMLSLYFHIPFCESKCGYCNLFSVTGQKEDFISSYLDAIERQALQYLENIYWQSKNMTAQYNMMCTTAQGNKPLRGCGRHELTNEKNKNFSSVSINKNSYPFFYSLTLGGGTPLLLSEKQLERLFSIAYQFPFIKNFPVVVETSPKQTTKAKLEILKQYGTTRISIGIQSFKEEELLSLNRSHTLQDCKRALYLIEDVGFSCRNIDLIYGIPGQTKQSLQYSLDAALFYQPEEIFLYPLYIKQGTPLYLKKTEISSQRYDLYLFASRYLLDQGYQQISMRYFKKILKHNNQNYCKENKENKDREKSCGFEHTLSLGCGGRSYLKNLHFCTPYHIEPFACLQEIHSFIEQSYYTPISFGYLLNGDEMLRRYIIKNLLHRNGIIMEDYTKARELCMQYQYYDFSENFDSIFKDFPILYELLEEKLMIQEKQRIVLTEKGISYSDAIGPLFISKTVKEKMKQWIDMK